MSFQTIDWHDHDFNIRSVARLRCIEVVRPICLFRLDSHSLSINRPGADVRCTRHWGVSKKAFAKEKPEEEVP